MKVLIACEHSGVVHEAFLARGYDAWLSEDKLVKIAQSMPTN